MRYIDPNIMAHHILTRRAIINQALLQQQMPHQITPVRPSPLGQILHLAAQAIPYSHVLPPLPPQRPLVMPPQFATRTVPLTVPKPPAPRGSRR